jgi:hypothetical protein
MIDLYTKIMLTVIASALVAIAIQNVVNPASAQLGLQKVQICDVLGDCAAMAEIMTDSGVSTHTFALHVSANK